MFSLRRVAASALLCSILVACGGGGGDDGAAPGEGGGGGGGPPSIPASNEFLPTDSSLRLTYSSQPAPAQFEPTTQRNSRFIAPFRYASGGKEYYVSTSDSVSFAGFYSPQILVSGAGSFTADARFDTPVTLFRTDSDAQRVESVNGTGTVTITPTYGDRPLTYAGTVSYLGTELVTSPLGRFPSKHVRLALSVSTTVEGTTFNVPFFVDLWFARNLGIVQRVEAGQPFVLTQATGPDSDGDGLFNGLDLFPSDPTETTDFDADGRGDNGDADDDNDTVEDTSDRFPRDPAESADFDNDRIGDNADLDDDNDGVPDGIDPFPFDIHNLDTDRDGIADFYDPDDDNDSVTDVFDQFPLDPTESADADGDGQGDNGDIDDDNDGTPDVQDAYPNDPVRHELLNVDRSTLGFTAVFGSAAMPAASINVTGFNIAWQAQSSAPWLQLSQLEGTGDTLVIVSTNTQGLAAGTHTGRLTFTDPSTPRSVEVNVQIIVSLPELNVTAASLSFDGKFRWTDLTRPIDVTLNTGLNSYPVSVAVSFDTPDAITTTFPDGVADFNPRRLNVTLDPAKLKGGRHTGQLTLTANVNGQPITRQVALEALASQRVLYPSDDGVALAQIGIYPQLRRTITVRDSYGISGTAWTASSDVDWVQITASGVTGEPLTITANPAGRAPGLHRGTITLSSSDSNIESTTPIQVSLWVQASHRNLGESLPRVYGELASDPLRPYVYAHNGSASSTIDVYNVHIREQLPSITSLSGVLGPMVTSSDGKWLFVLDPTNGSVTRIDLDNTASRTTWPLTDLKPLFGQPSTLAFARPNGRPVLLLNDGRFVDATTGAVFPIGVVNTLGNFEVARPSFEGDRVCVATTQSSPFSGSCFPIFFGDYGTPDVRTGNRTSISGFEVPGAGFATDIAVTAEGDAIVGIENNTLPVVCFFSASGGYAGPVLAPDPTGARRGARSVATGSDGAIYADVIGSSDGLEYLYIWNANRSLRTRLQFDRTHITGVFRQLVVTGDAMGAVYLTGSSPPLPAESTELRFIRSY